MGQQCVVVLDFFGQRQKYVLEDLGWYSVAVCRYPADYLLPLLRWYCPGAGMRQVLLGDEECDGCDGAEHRGAMGYFCGSIPAFSAEHKRGDDAVQDEPEEPPIKEVAPA